MKTNLLRSVLALLALCTAVNLRADPSPAASRRLAGELPVSAVAARVPANGDTVTVGTSRVMVSLRLGSPNAVLRDGNWLYHDYTATADRGNLAQAGTLVVRFISGRVSRLTLADESTVVALRQERQQPDRNQLLAAGTRW